MVEGATRSNYPEGVHRSFAEMQEILHYSSARMYHNGSCAAVVLAPSLRPWRKLQCVGGGVLCCCCGLLSDVNKAILESRLQQYAVPESRSTGRAAVSTCSLMERQDHDPFDSFEFGSSLACQSLSPIVAVQTARSLVV